MKLWDYTGRIFLIEISSFVFALTERGQYGASTVERFSYYLEMKAPEQKRNNERTEIERFDWFIERTRTPVFFGWLSELSGGKNFIPENFLKINRYFALTSHCKTIGQSNNAFSKLAGKRRGHDHFIFQFTG